jgi:tetratricopeptide (TPR) repeat protein
VLLRRPDDYDANVKLCHALLQVPDVTAARPIAETVLAMASNLPWGDLLVGIVLILEGQARLAEDHLRRARDLGQNVDGIALRIGWVNLLLDRANDSEAAFRETVAKDNGSAEAHTGLGIALAAQDRDEEAEQTLKRAIALEFHNPLAHLYLGQILARQDNDSETLRVLRTALAQAPQSAEAKAALAGIERKLANEMIKQAAASRDTSRPS